MRENLRGSLLCLLLWYTAILFYVGGSLEWAFAQAPIISNVQSSNVTDFGGTISWKTDIESTSQVTYWIDPANKSFTDVDMNKVTSHSVTLEFLGSNSKYSYQVRSVANGTETISPLTGEYTFTTRATICGKPHDLTITNISPATVQVNTNILLTVSFTSTDSFDFTKAEFRLIWEPEATSATDRRSAVVPKSVSGSGTNWNLTFLSGPLSQANQNILVSLSASFFCTGITSDVTSNIDSQLQAISPPIPASVTAINPVSGPLTGGTFIIITGKGFRDGAMVKIGDITSLISSVTDTEIRATTGKAALAGIYDVVVSNPDGQFATLTDGFSYESSHPYFFAHIAAGERWRTTFTFVNTSTQTVSCTTSLYSNSGGPLALAFDGNVSSIWTHTIPGGGTARMQTDAYPTGPVLTGWARSDCSGPIKASALFRSYQGEEPEAEASVIAVTPWRDRFHHLCRSVDRSSLCKSFH